MYPIFLNNNSLLRYPITYGGVLLRDREIFSVTGQNIPFNGDNMPNTKLKCFSDDFSKDNISMKVSANFFKNIWDGEDIEINYFGGNFYFC